MNIGEFEEIVMLAIMGLGNETYGVPLREAIEEAGRSTSVGALYTTLERLEKKKLVESWHGEVTPERGGKAKKFFRVTGAGQLCLQRAETTRMTLRKNLNPIGGTT